MRIAEVARRSGFSAATLRFYEQINLLPAPGRTAAGYRAYDESVLARLAFIARAKALGCSLEEIADLMPEWDGGRCAPVQDRLRELAAAKLDVAQARVGEMVAFTADLQRILNTLGSHTPEGPCDSDCGCSSDAPLGPSTLASVALGPKPVGHAAAPIACTLTAPEIPERLEKWQELLGHVDERETLDGGLRLQFDLSTPLDQLTQLVGAEQACCGFFAFAITVDNRGVGLEVRAPAEAQPIVASLFGAA